MSEVPPSPVDTNFSSTTMSSSISASSSSSFSNKNNLNTAGSRALSASTNVAELVIAEAHYLSTLKRVGNALNLASNHSLAQGRKASNTVRALVERWTTMMHLHIKFHDDIVAVKEDVHGATKLLHDLLLTLEPVLVNHCRDLSSAVFKLSRNDKKSGHKPAEWDGALRHPFDHLTVYNEWLQRIDPLGRFNRESLAQLNHAVLNFKSVIEANQNPRGMFKRISTLARNVIRRPSGSQLLSPGTGLNSNDRINVLTNDNYGSWNGTILNQGLETSPTSSTTSAPLPSPGTAITVVTTTTEFMYLNPKHESSISLRAAAAAAAMAAMEASENRMETVSDQVSVLQISNGSDRGIPSRGASSHSLAAHGMGLSSSTSKDSTTLLNRRQHPNRVSVACSDVSSVGSLTLAASSESLHSKALHSNGVPTTPTGNGPTLTRAARPSYTLGRQLSGVSQRQQELLDEEQQKRELRKVTLRSGTQSLIAQKAELLQQQQYDSLRKHTARRYESKQEKEARMRQREREGKEAKERMEREREEKERGTVKGLRRQFVSRPSIDRLRCITKKEVEVKPPVKNLISFWEKTTAMEPAVEA